MLWESTRLAGMPPFEELEDAGGEFEPTVGAASSGVLLLLLLLLS